MTANSRFSLSVNMTSGRADDDDQDRAAAAAVASLDAAGVSIDAAYAEFQRQWAAMDEEGGIGADYAHMTGLAAVWIAAESAANLALTEGWARPDGASCGISA